MQPPVLARRARRDGSYVLHELPGDSYVQVVDTGGSVSANLADLGTFAGSLLESLPPVDPIYPTVAYEDGRAAPGVS